MQADVICIYAEHFIPFFLKEAQDIVHGSSLKGRVVAGLATGSFVA